MSPELIAILGVGVAGLALNWRMTDSLGKRLDTRTDALHADIAGVKDRIGNMEQRLARIEGWIAGRFREETMQS
jgi:hypothetical protein